MRVLIITWEFPPYVVGGLGKHVAELVPHLGGLPSDDGELIVDVLTTRYAGGDAVEKLNQYTTVYRVDTPPMDRARSLQQRCGQQSAVDRSRTTSL